MPIQDNYRPYNFNAARGIWLADGSFKYPDGGIASRAEIDAARSKAGLPPLEAMRVDGLKHTDPKAASMDPMMAQGTGVGGEPIAPVIDATTSPGASLDTAAADAERERLAPMLAELQQQAATGGGAWEGTLADATQKADASVQALGQSQPGAGYASALRNIGNAQGAVAQRAVGQGNILREQSKQDATNQLSSLLAGQGAQDIHQASASADTKFGVRSAQEGIRQEDKKSLIKKQNQTWDDLQKATSIVGAAMSDGGEVPGKARVFGDDSRNDTVPAKLSPGEIVIPRSHASSPESAADFVRALQAQKGEQHFAEGGNVQGGYQDPTIANGAMLDTGNFNQNRRDTDSLLKTLEARANRASSPMVGQQMQNASDANIASAMQAGNRRSSGDVLQAAGAAQQDAAGNAAAGMAGEQQQSRQALTQGSLGQRDREMGMAQAQQQAAWRNTLMNTGISIADMALMGDMQAKNSARIQGVASGVGQGLAAWQSAGGGKQKASNSYEMSNQNTPDFDQGFGSGGNSGGSDPSEWENPYWTGGRVEKKDTRGADFVRALRRGRA